MNKKTFRRFLAFVLVLAMTMSTVVTVNTASAASKKVTKVTVTSKANASTELREGTKITKSLLKKLVKVNYSYKSGKKTKTVTNYTGFTSPQIGKTVSGSKMKFTVKVGKKKKSTTVKVNKITGIEVAYTTLILVEGDDISFEAFRDFTKVKATYQRGSAKTISNYKIDSVKTSADGDFKVTVKYGKYTSTVAVPVISKEPEPTVAPTVKPTVVPTVKPTVVPTVKPTVVPTVKPTVVPTVKPMATPGGNGGGGGTIIVPKPTVTPSAKPTATPTDKPTGTLVPEYTVTVNSSSENVKFNGRSMSFNNGKAAENVVSGTKVSLSATDSSSSRFVRWADSTGKELSTSKTYEFTVSSNTSITAVFETVYTLTVKRVGGKGKVTVGGESLDFYSNKAELSLVPGIYTLSATGTDDYQFVNWTNSSGTILSTSSDYKVSVAADTTITAKFAEVEKTTTVTYKFESGTIIASEAVAFGETLVPPKENLYKADKTFKGWKIGEVLYSGNSTDSEFYDEAGNKLSDVIKALTGEKYAVVVTAYYEDNPVYYTVSVNGGTLQDAEGNTISNSVLSGTHVYVVANVPDGKLFSSWQDGDEKILSYYAKYDFYVSSDITLNAVFSDVPVPVEPIVALRGSGYSIATEESTVTFLTTIDIPDEYTNLEWGMIVSTKLDEFDYDTTGILKIQDTDARVINSKYADSKVSLTMEALFTRHVLLRGRAYAKVQDASGQTKTIYSSVIQIQL